MDSNLAERRSRVSPSGRMTRDGTKLSLQGSRGSCTDFYVPLNFNLIAMASTRSAQCSDDISTTRHCSLQHYLVTKRVTVQYLPIYNA